MCKQKRSIVFIAVVLVFISAMCVAGTPTGQVARVSLWGFL